MNGDTAKLAQLLKGLEHPDLKAIDLSLDRMQAFLARLGHPEKHMPPVIHIAGTNGKGSLAAYLSAIFASGGVCAHRYTSPHLVHFRERIFLNGSAIEEAELLELLLEVKQETTRQPVTFFEATTAAAFLAFSRRPADIAILETGLGGRLDATNVVARPLLTAITPVGIDHAEYLGETLSQIAGEKAGIMKRNAVCVLGPQEEAALRVMEAKAKLLSVKLLRHGQEWEMKSEDASRFAYRSARGTMRGVQAALPGRHQHANAATAIACAEALTTYFPLNEKAIRAGLMATRWPGRLQCLAQGRLAEIAGTENELWLDGGHNPHAAMALRRWAEDKDDDKPFYLICGMLENKDAAGFLRAFAGLPRCVYAVPIRGEAHQAVPGLVSLARSLGMNAAEAQSPADALQQIRSAKNGYSCGPVRVLIAGSLYLAGEVLKENA